jgi:hypothetical protein
VKRGAATVVLLGLAFLMQFTACARHKDFPAMLPVIAPPTPTNFAVTTTDDVIYDLSWSVSDPSSVAMYRIYSLDIFTGAPTVLDTTTATAAQVNTLVPTPGFVFGVSSVSVQNVESRVVFASAP